MSCAKDNFKLNFIKQARLKGISSGTELARLASALGAGTVEKTYCNDLLNENKPAINLSLDKAELLSKTLGVSLKDMLSDEKSSNEQMELETLRKHLCIAKQVASQNNINNAEFIAELTSVLMLSTSEEFSLSEIVRLTKKFS